MFKKQSKKQGPSNGSRSLHSSRQNPPSYPGFNGSSRKERSNIHRPLDRKKPPPLETKDLQALAKALARDFHTNLTPEDITELISHINDDWLKVEGKQRLLELLGQIRTSPGVQLELVNVKDIPRLLPLPRPFHTRERAPLLLSKIRRRMTDSLKECQLEEYVKERELVLIREILEKGREHAVFIDVPTYVTHKAILKRLRPRLLKILDGKDEELRVA
jgi:hypothetical protein